ncbi:MAG: tRNA dihydrouridine(20/20a) synthase DusA [Pseudomonadota bacterium]
MSPPAHRLSVAPMMEWTDRHCRYFLRLLAPRAQLYTEMVVAAAIVHGDRDRFLAFDGAEHPLVLQLGGSDPAQLAQAARVAREAYGYDEINLNVGCPSDRVQSGRFGACLMREPDLVARCLESMARAVDVPVTVKTRLGVDEQDSYEFLVEFLEAVRAVGCGTVILHARKALLSGLSPKQNREIPPLDYARVQRVKRDFPQLTVVINGGIASAELALEQLEAGLDGVMVGRMAYHDPWRFAALEQAVFGSERPPNRASVVLAFEPYLRDQHARGVPLKVMTRHLCGLFSGCYGARRWRRAMSDPALIAEHQLDILRYGLSLVSEAPVPSDDVASPV